MILMILTKIITATNPPRRRTSSSRLHTLAIALLLALFASAASAQEAFKLHATYICSGEHIYVDGCNIRDLSDTATCSVVHPDHVNASGLAAISSETRGSLKQRLPSCTQPSAQQVAAAQAQQKRQDDLYNANVAKANAQLNGRPQAGARPASASPGQIAPPKNAEERAMRRCVSSGRLPSTCTGNSLLGAFGQMLSSVLPSAGAASQPTSGPTMAGVFQGAGGWRLDFIDGGVLVNCTGLSPNQESYTVDLRNNRATLTINTRPKPLILAVRGDGTISGPGPVILDGVIASGTVGGSSTPGHTETSQVTNHEIINQNQANAYSGSNTQITNMGGGFADAATTTTKSTYVPGTSTPAYNTFSPKRVTCPALNLTSKGAGPGIQTMQTDLLKSMLGGDKGPATPPGIRMHGIFAASTGFSLEFYPESVILGCGPDSARAYPYTVTADGARTAVQIAAPDHPLTVAFRPDGTLDPGSAEPYQVHGRIVTGQDDNDDFTFAPMEQTCNLAALSPAKAIPSGGGVAGTMVASAAAPATVTSANLSTPGSTLGNATLAIVSGFPAQPGAPNPLAAKPYTLLRDSVATIVAKAGVAVPPGASPYKVLGLACGNRTPDCQKILDAIKASAASSVRSDANGSGIFPGVAPGTYYLMITAAYNGKSLTWGQAVQVKPGANSVTLNLSNATPLN